MFTGIVAASCEVVSTDQGEEVRSIVVDLSGYDDDLEIGASVAIDGVCMTVVSSLDGHVRFEAIPETLERTTIGLLKQGSQVNIERSLRMGDELGGHILSGHVMTTARILQRTQKGEGIDLLIEHQVETKPYILEKGYVAIDGNSKTK
ncbi:MAG: riboflavin synthase, partial [Euryarchaeota archaeon]